MTRGTWGELEKNWGGVCVPKIHCIRSEILTEWQGEDVISAVLSEHVHHFLNCRVFLVEAMQE